MWLGFSYYASSSAAATINQTARPIRLGQDGFVNPLLEYTAAENQFSEIAPLNEALSDRIAMEVKNGNATNIGVFFQDLSSGRWAGVNQSDKFSPASLQKSPSWSPI